MAIEQVEPNRQHTEPSTNGAAEIEPGARYKFSPEKIRAIITLPPTSPNYPLARPFEDDYIGSNNYEFKYAIAKALIEGHYKNLRFLVNNFFPADVEPTPEMEDLKKHLGLKVREELIKRGDGRERKAAEQDLEDFVKDASSEQRTQTGEEFRKLVGLFGSSRVVDILYRSRPEFRGIPVEHVKGVLAEYLGDFLMIRGGFNPDDLDLGRKYLSDPDLQEGLLEVIKDSCLASHQQNKKAGSLLSDQALVEEYLSATERDVARFEDPNLDRIVTSVRKYYQELFEIQMPDNVVTSLKPTRAFPDLGQLINIKEIADKRRIAIADGMGLGKSASAILAKEHLGAKLALVIAPSNVIEDPTAWRAYLSDQVDKDGKQIGYFKPGQAPKVLVVQNPQSLYGVNSEVYDYVLVSHEKLTDNYIDDLLSLDFDMLIVDEVHKLKNLRTGVRAANLLRLAEKVEDEGQYVVPLSGTPADNKVEDIAMLLKLLYPHQFKEVGNTDLVRMIIRGDYIDLRRLLMPRMQMKSLSESISMPELTEETVYVDLSPLEREVYEVLMEEDEIEATEKIRMLRQFPLNPDLLKITPGVESSKLRRVQEDLQGVYKDKDKAIMFVNDYVEGILRGENALIDRLVLPAGVETRVVAGHVSREERAAIQSELRQPDKRIFLAVSGGTADVGVNYTPAQHLIFLNDPWTKYKKDQELHRAYREGLEHPLTSTTYIARNTIEEGIESYIEAKYKAVEKLLRGIPITVLDQELLEKAEAQDEELEVNPELAEYYFSAWDRMRKIFAYVKEIGETDFRKFLIQYGSDYAQCYVDLGSRSYQANASRVSGTLIDEMAQNQGQEASDVSILDLASGPEMLRRHMPDHYDQRIFSMDINPLHFMEEDGDKRVVGSFLKLPFANESFDYTNLSLAWHYASFIPSRDRFERLQVLREIHRTLKTGGRAILNLIYSLDLKDEAKFREVAETAGFRVVDEYSGQVENGRNYASRVVTLEKHEDLGWTMDETVQLIGKENFDGLKFAKTDTSLRDSRKIIKDFGLAGRLIPISFNDQDYQALLEEEQVTSEAESLKAQYGSIDRIPKDVVVGNNFIRVLMGKRFALFKRLQTAGGVVVVK
jgi:SAM-dependent methyltransferase